MKKPRLDLSPNQHTRNPTLRNLLDKAETHREVEKKVLRALPTGLENRVRFVSLREGDMTLSTDTSAVASQIRMRQHEIMANLRQEPVFQYVWRLQIKVVPARFRNRASHTKEPISHKNAQLLKEEAGHTKDKNLREVLEKLASHVRD
ncbi:DciA family protein [Marinobacter salicampi]|uniref:DciA family protein n=1 Tax=Marinobacter salicampi TaxID=435907 RepID=UPI00140A1808|nr:DciA family protein [Marinobacter salicampi]